MELALVMVGMPQAAYWSGLLVVLSLLRRGPILSS